MTKTVLGGAVAIAWCVAAPFAQQPPASTSNAPAHNVFVLTGCLEAGPDATATFKLTDASAIGKHAPAGAGEAGAVGTSGQKVSYELRPASGVNAQGLNAEALKAQVGRRVEVVVRPLESPAPAPTGGAVIGEAARPVPPAPQRFSVTELKRVSGRC